MQINVGDFVKESWEDYKSPTTSTFTSKMGHCRHTVSTLEEVSLLMVSHLNSGTDIQILWIFYVRIIFADYLRDVIKFVRLYQTVLILCFVFGPVAFPIHLHILHCEETHELSPLGNMIWKDTDASHCLDAHLHYFLFKRPITEWLICVTPCLMSCNILLPFSAWHVFLLE